MSVHHVISSSFFLVYCTFLHNCSSHYLFFRHCNHCGAGDHLRKACQRLLLQEKLGTMREHKENQKKASTSRNKKNDGKRNQKTLRLCTLRGDQGHTSENCQNKDNICNVDERYVPSLAVIICYILFKVM